MTKAFTTDNIRNASGGILTEKQLQGFLEEIKTHPELSGKSEALVNKAFINALANHRDGLKFMNGEAFPFEMKHVIASCKELAANTVQETGKVASHAERVVNELRHLEGYSAPVIPEKISKYTHDQKMNAGMAFLMAGLSALGTWSSACTMKTTDEQGVSHWSPTAVGFTLLQGALAAGMAYAGVCALRGAPAGRV